MKIFFYDGNLMGVNILNFLNTTRILFRQVTNGMRLERKQQCYIHFNEIKYMIEIIDAFD